MKKTLSAVLALFCILSMLTLPAFAASGKLSAESVKGAVGDTVTVPVKIDNPGIVATRIFVRYDSQTLKITAVENGEVFPDNKALFGNDLNADPYTMVWEDSLRKDNVTSDGVLCTLQFKVLKGTSSGETVIRFAVSAPDTFDVDLNDVTIADCSCTVHVPTDAAATTKAATPTTTKAGTPATTKAGTPAATTKAGTPATTKAGTPATTKAGTPTTTKAGTPATTKAGTPATTKAGTPATTKAGTPATTKAGTPATTKAVTPATTKAGTPATTKAGTPASTTTVTPNETATAAAQTADGAEAPTVPESAVPAEMTIEALAEETAATNETAAAEADTQEASAALVSAPESGPDERSANKLLWLLLLIPVAGVVVFIILKKKKA